MAKREKLTIGEVARRTGLPVKTLRFWSDEGLLPTAGRTASGYRLYGDEALARLDLVRTLREAGLGLDAIKKVLRRDMSLADALRLRLAAVEAHAASLQRVAAALRAALRSNDPGEDDVRRLSAVTRLTNEDRKAVIQKFYAQVGEGIPNDSDYAEFKKKMAAASAVDLPDNPTPAQLDAWIELAEIVQDPSFVENMKKSAQTIWQHKIDMKALAQTNDEAGAAAGAARAKGLAPESAEGKKIVAAYCEGLAKASGREATDAMKKGVRDRFVNHDPRAARYWELVAIMRGLPPGARPGTPQTEDWKWIAAAVIHHLA